MEKTGVVGGSRRFLWKVIAVGAVLAAVLVPAASAKSGPRLRLSVLPLPKSALGPAAKSLALQHDSGVLYNGGPGSGNMVNKLCVCHGLPVTPNRSFGPAGAVFQKLGRISGYALDYGIGSSGGTNVTEIRTSVDEYKTNAGAKKGLAFWNAVDWWVNGYGGGGLTIALKAEKVEPVGSRRFAFLVSYSAANLTPLFGLDEQFTEGRYQADVTVWAGTAATATRLAPRLARRLDTRIKLALAGRLHAKPVKLPPKQKAERWPGGPDLAPLALHAADVGGQGTAFLDNYFVGEDLFALSYFKLDIFNAGQFEWVGQDIEWFATANQASLLADLTAAHFDGYSVDLSAVGDGARGALANNGGGDSTGYSEIVFSSGPLAEFIYLQSASSIPASEVEKIAKTVANKINAAGLAT